MPFGLNFDKGRDLSWATCYNKAYCPWVYFPLPTNATLEQASDLKQSSSILVCVVIASKVCMCSLCTTMSMRLL